MKVFGSLPHFLTAVARRHPPGAPRRFALALAGGLALACAAVPLPAQSLLFAQYFGPPPPGIALAGSDVEIPYQRADRFSLSLPSAVTRVRWYGNITSNGTTFLLRFFANAGSGPVSVPFYEQSVTPVQTVTVLSVSEYVANLSPAVSLDPGVTYYISIVENLRNGFPWYWVLANHSGSKENLWTRASDTSEWATFSFDTNKLSFELYGFVGADVGVEMVAIPDPVQHGPNLTYAITVTNHGRLTARYVILENVLPPEVTFKKLTTPGTAFAPHVGATGTVLIDLGDLAAGATAQTSIEVKVRDRDAASLSNTVSVSSTTYDPAPANNTATINTGILGHGK